LQGIQAKIISIAEACLGGLRGRSALLIGPGEVSQPYKTLLLEAGMKTIFQESDYSKVASLLPHVQLLMNIAKPGSPLPLLTAGTIAGGCVGRHTPLLIFDLAPSTSVEELAGLLPAVCLYTPDDLRRILYSDAQVSVRIA
jgi:glutamyl-tRNA reductase